MRYTRSTGMLVATAFAIAVGAHAAQAQSDTVPTAASAIAADKDLARAMRENDADGIVRWLDRDWAVVTGRGGIGEGVSIFPDGIKTGELTRKTYEISEPRVRIYDNTALVTEKVNLSGVFGGKPFDVQERQTNVWLWKDGGWKCVLTHETMIPGKTG